jgi:hypothetical protein
LETKALPVLLAAGFEEQPNTTDHLHLTRNDPAILYMFVDILNSTIEASKLALDDFVGMSAAKQGFPLVAATCSIGGT